MLLAGAACLAATGQAAAPAEHGEHLRFAPPLERPMLLSRTLRRDLADGKQIVATRRYRVSFVREGAGWRVDGELVASEIEAPEALRAFAELERNRPDDGLFPLRLDAHGMIAERETPGEGDQGRASVEQAVALALTRLGKPELPSAAPMRAFLGQIQALAAAAVTTEWPTGLFLPAGGADRKEKHFALPNGNRGVLISEVEMAPSPDFATMAQCERRIITEIAGDRRISREQWTLEPMPRAS
jgi:hypothetical protein